VRQSVILRVVSLVLFLGFWEALSRSGLVLDTVLPPASEVVVQGIQLFQMPTIWKDAYASVYEIVVGLAIGGMFGVLGGCLVGSSCYLSKLFEPIFFYLASVPKIILLPIFVLFLGIGLGSKIGMSAVSAFFPIIVNTALAIREVKPIYVRVGRTFGASRLQLYRSVFAPSVLGPVLSGIRLGLGVAITGALLAETKVAQFGLGFRAIELYSQLRIAEMYALLILVFVCAAAVNLLLGYFISRTTRFAPQMSQGTLSVG
jgi:ABC-type nitrate/sulfonate/bicarbonate transport system permease component